MTTIPTIIYALLLSYCFAKRNYWQFQDRLYYNSHFKGLYQNASASWHRWQFFVQLLMFSYPAIIGLIYQLNGTMIAQWQDIFLGGAIFWLAFDGFLNKFNGNDLLYVGGGAIDSYFKGKGGLMLVVKGLLIAASVWLYNF